MKEYQHLVLVLFMGLFWSGNVFAQTDNDEEKIGTDQQEERDVEEFLKSKIDQLKKEVSERERFFEHTYFYYHEHLQSIRSKNLNSHPFFGHYKTCLTDTKEKDKKEDSNYCSMLSQVFVDALWDLDARWRQMRTSGIRYRKKISKISPALNYVQYLIDNNIYLEKFGPAESLRIYLLALKNNVLNELPIDLKDEYVELVKSLDDFDPSGEEINKGEYLEALKATFSTIIDGPLLKERDGVELVEAALSLHNPSIKILKEALLADYGHEFLNFDQKEIEEKNNKKFELSDLLNFEADFNQLDEELKDLKPDEESNFLDFSKWQATERLLKYKKAPRVYVLCRKNREIPCLMVIRNEKGEWATQDGKKNQNKIWQQKVMASSNKGWSFYKRLGHTPSGVYSIDGVMPFTNRQKLFGKFHRLIINYLPGNAGDLSYSQKFIPESWQDADWWKQAPLAKVLGRNLIRIHGTGKRARRATGYYPLVKTNGCIAEVEGTYFGKKQTGQKDLLDKLQQIQKIKGPDKIHALLYVIEIDDKNEQINSSEIQKVLINKSQAPVLI